MSDVNGSGPAWRYIPIRRDDDDRLVPFTGWTGYDGKDLPWPRDAVTSALCCPDGAMMLDADQYDAKTGADTLAGLERELGPLPPTVKITSRGPGDPGGKYPYRVPPGTILKGSAGKDVETIQRHHRWTWAPWTPHPKTRTPVDVYDAHGVMCELPPVGSLPWLPQAWLDHLRADAREMTAGDADLPDGDGRCPVALAWLAKADLTGASATGERANKAVNYLKRMDAEGHEVGGVIDDVIAALPLTSYGDFAGMWATAPVPADCWQEQTCCTGTFQGLAAVPAAALNGHAPQRDQAATPPTPPIPPADGPVTLTPSGVEVTTRDPSPDDPILDEDAARAWARNQPWMRFFEVGPKGGLEPAVFRLAGGVATMGPLATGTDNRMWAYRNGVYAPAPNVVRERVALLLKDKYQRSHATNAGDIVMAGSPLLSSDPDERYVNVRNGLLNWRTGELAPHTPKVPSTVQLAVDWQPEATCPAFDAWLAQVIPPDCTRLAWELIGYLCYSGNPLHTAVMLTGSGRNGKGTFLRVVTAIIGKANTTAVTLHDLVGNKFRVARLFGRLANIAGDIDGTYLEDTAMFKAITGQDQVTAEHKNKDPFDFTPWAVPVFSANKIPASADTTAGYLSRWLILPFPNSFAGREDRTIEAKLHAELPGILAAGLRQLPALLDRGQWLQPEKAVEAKADFERRVDQVRTWLAECCTVADDNTLVKRTQMYLAYKRWAVRDGGKPVAAAEFYNRLGSYGVLPGAENGVRGFRGVRVTDEAWDYRSGM